MLSTFCLGILVEISYQIVEIKAYAMRFLCKYFNNSSYSKNEVINSINFIPGTQFKRRTARKKAVLL